MGCFFPLSLYWRNARNTRPPTYLNFLKPGLSAIGFFPPRCTIDIEQCALLTKRVISFLIHCGTVFDLWGTTEEKRGCGPWGAVKQRLRLTAIIKLHLQFTSLPANFSWLLELTVSPVWAVWSITCHCWWELEGHQCSIIQAGGAYERDCEQTCQR